MIIGDKMTKISLAILIGILLLLSTNAFATPPDSIKMSFDSTGTIMTARIFHNTKNLSVHYITLVTLQLNGKQIIQQTISRQFSKTEQDVVYEIIDAKKGDQIALTAQCILYGKKTEVLTY
jgi:hypothetical protein